ncbi:MAG: T9SS type A sorting domain-containing protein [Bacteroidales bacterium]|nr:T9SS type A sorting domain-containing protein [Bacteroidales bacterium]
MRRHIVLLLICLIPNIVWSQGWELYFDQPCITNLNTGDSNENGHYFFGKIAKPKIDENNVAYAMFVDNDGSYKYNYYIPESGQNYFSSALCLENGNAFVAGLKNPTEYGDEYKQIWIAIINQELEIVEEHTYPLPSPYFLAHHVCVAAGTHGDIILAVAVRRVNPNWTVNNDCMICRFDVHGNMLESKITVTPFLGHVNPRDLSIMQGSENMMLMSSGFNSSGGQCISYFDKDLNFFSHHNVLDGRLVAEWMNSSIWLDNTHFLMSAMIFDRHSADENEIAAVFKCDTTLALLDTLIYNRVDTADYTPSNRALQYVNDSTIYFATYHQAFFGTINSVVMMLIDKDLNLLGTKCFRYDDRNFNIYHMQKTHDGGCLIYGNCKFGEQNAVYIKKLMREDFVVPLSVVENTEVCHGVDVYPNPTTDILNISINDVENQEVVVSVCSISGQKMLERKLSLSDNSTIKIDVSSFENGVYFYDVLNGKNSLRGKFIKD